MVIFDSLPMIRRCNVTKRNITHVWFFYLQIDHNLFAGNLFVHINSEIIEYKF